MDFGFGGDSYDDESELDGLVIDDSLPDPVRYLTYVGSEMSLHRLFMVKDVTRVARAVGFETTKAELLPTFDDLVTDVNDGVRQTLALNIPALCEFLVECGDEGYSLVADVLFAILAELAVDSVSVVRSPALQSVVAVAKLLKPAERASKVVPLIEGLVTDLNEEDHRVEACVVVDMVAEHFGAAEFETLLLPMLQTLASDPMYRVRKEVAANLETMIGALGSAKVEELILPIYLGLAVDEIWGVRKACAESLAALSAVVSRTVRLEKLEPLFHDLAEDVSRWVRSAAYQALGPFIATFDAADVSDRCLTAFADMISPAHSKNVDSEITMHCAYNFPGVLYTVGGTKWPVLSATYNALVSDLQWKVRQTLAHSLHEIAGILGPELTAECLEDVFELFFDDIDEVRTGLVTHVAAFISCLPEDRRPAYVKYLATIEKDDSWRLRELLALQLEELARLFSGDSLVEGIVPLVLSMCQDPVASVREQSITALGAVVSQLDRGSDAYVSLLDAVEENAAADTYRKRQAFIAMGQHIAPYLSEEEFEQRLVSHWNVLKDDKVPNVRIALAQSLYSLSETEQFAESPTVASLLASLRDGDSDRDVRIFAGAVEELALLLRVESSDNIAGGSEWM